MSDRDEIQDLLTRYSQGCSCADWDLVMGTFLPDGVWEVPARGIRQEGHAAMRAAMSGFVSHFSWYAQLNSPALITIDGDRATARSMFREIGAARSGGDALEVVGFYDDDLVRTDEGWKFAVRRSSGLGLHGITLAPPPMPG